MLLGFDLLLFHHISAPCLQGDLQSKQQEVSHQYLTNILTCYELGSLDHGVCLHSQGLEKMNLRCQIYAQDQIA